ncbi:MAG: PqqD family protein [candidate division WOR-3 bacterium]
MRRKEGLLTQRIEDGLIIYDPEEDRSFVLNETAALVWENAELTESEIARLLVGEYGIAEDQALADAAAFIEELAQMGLLA